MNKILKKIYLIGILSLNLHCSLLVDYITILPITIAANHCTIKILYELIFNTHKPFEMMSTEECIEYNIQNHSREIQFFFLGMTLTSLIITCGMTILRENEIDNFYREQLKFNVDQIAIAEKNPDSARNINELYFFSANDDIYRDYHHGLFNGYIIHNNGKNILIISPHANTENKDDDREPEIGIKSSKDAYKVISMIRDPKNRAIIEKAYQTKSLIFKLFEHRKIFSKNITYIFNNDTKYENT